MMKTKGKANGDDLVLGKNLRRARNEALISQDMLGKKLDITFQQIQKYEKGINRISAVRLQEMSIIFDKPMTWFFSLDEQSPRPDNKEEGILLDAWRGVIDRNMRSNILSIIKIAGAS